MNIQSAIQFLVGLLVFGLVMWCVWLVLGMFPLPYPAHQIIMVIFGLIALAYLLKVTGFLSGPPGPLP